VLKTSISWETIKRVVQISTLGVIETFTAEFSSAGFSRATVRSTQKREFLHYAGLMLMLVNVEQVRALRFFTRTGDIFKQRMLPCDRVVSPKPISGDEK